MTALTFFELALGFAAVYGLGIVTGIHLSVRFVERCLPQRPGSAHFDVEHYVAQRLKGRDEHRR